MSFNPDNTKVTSGRDGSSYKSSDTKTKPTTDPDSTKDFKKILDKDAGEKEDQDAATSKQIIEEEDAVITALSEGVKKKTPASLFDLTAAAGGKKSPSMAKSVKSEKTPVMPEDTEDGLSDKKVTSAIKPMKDSGLMDDSSESDKKALAAAMEKDKFTTRFATEQTDLSYVNPLAATANQQPSVNLNISTEKAIVPVRSIQDIINQMIAKVTEIKTTGQTDTVVTLKYPPLFEGAQIVVTSFDNAKNEFNISIENLTQQAKNLMDQKVNRDHLLSSLEQKGYAVHILATTTVTENRIAPPIPEEQFTRRQRDQEQEQQQGRQQQQRGRERQT
jgi:hypothetical protein